MGSTFKKGLSRAVIKSLYRSIAIICSNDEVTKAIKRSGEIMLHLNVVVNTLLFVVDQVLASSEEELQITVHHTTALRKDNIRSKICLDGSLSGPSKLLQISG